MRIAFASPLRPQASGVSDYTGELVPVLGRAVDITLVTDGITPTAPGLAAFPRLDLRALDRRAHEFDAVVYHLGNAPLYANLYNTALNIPGVIVLHDLVLHHLRAWQTIERGDAGAYFDALRSAYGDELAGRARAAPAAINRFEYPLSEEVVRRARGVIVHSEYAAACVRQFVDGRAPAIPVAHVPMGITPAPLPNGDPAVSAAAARAALGLPKAALIVGAFGEVHPHKRITVVLQAFAEFRRTHPHALLVLVGQESPNFPVGELVRALGLEGAVRRVGFAPPADYTSYLAASDICLNLRYPSAGETSASLLRLLAAGKVTFVTRTGAYAELPDDVCIKIEPDAHEQELIVRYLEYFAARPEARHLMGTRAHEHVARHHTLKGAASGYVELLKELVSVKRRAESDE